MSGGSMNYLYSKVLHCADFSLDTPEREAFAKHLKLVAQALHDIEWVDSGDYGPGDENAAIRACLRPEQPKAEPNAEYERGFIEGMLKQAQSSVDKAVNRMAELVQEPPRAYYTIDEINAKFAPPQRKPLTDGEIVEAVREADLDWQAGWTLDEHEPNRFTTLVRAVERAHGITGDESC